MQIRLSDLDLSDVERGYAKEALESGWISSSGSFVGKAEQAWAEFCDVRHCSLVCNGTAALHLALMAVRMKAGDEVIVPGMTFVSPAAVVARMGGVPVLADVEETSWCIDPDDVQSLVTSRTRGVIAVDVLGHPADYDRLRQICDRDGLFLIEDAAEAHGSRYRGRRTGGLADIATFSFFANKTIACGEGGAVVTSDPAVFERLGRLKNHGMTVDRPYWHEEIGDNFRISNLIAAVLLGQIQRAEELIARRNAVAQQYRRGLEGTPGLQFRPAAEWAEVATWLEVLRVDPTSGIDRDSLISALRGAGVDARALWTPLVDLPPFKATNAERGIQTPLARQILAETMWLPTASTLTEEDVQTVIEITGETVRRAQGR